MKKALKITGIILGGIVILLGIFLAVWFLYPWNKTFFEKATKEFSIPGLDTDFVPQGFTTVSGQNSYIIGGYMADGSPSRYYVVNKEDGSVEKYFTLTVEGEDYAGHACGITSYESNLWICSKDTYEDGRAYRFLLEDVLTAENGSKIEVVDYFNTNNGADNITVFDGYLWVGEFYRKGNYDTDTSHKITTRDNKTNYAVAFGYEIDEYNTCGVKDTIPDMALSTIGLVQGMAFSTEGNIILSTSYSLPDSNIYGYKNVLTENAHSTITVNQTDVPLWFLDGESLINKVNAPAMTEEIVIEDNKLFILFESACKKYKIFNRKKIKDVYSLPLSLVLNEK